MQLFTFVTLHENSKKSISIVWEKKQRVRSEKPHANRFIGSVSKMDSSMCLVKKCINSKFGEFSPFAKN